MTVEERINNLIKERVYVSSPITKKSNLYTELGFDSLSFVSLLTDIEELYGIVFDITEMEACLQLEQLITIVERRTKERDRKDD